MELSARLPASEFVGYEWTSAEAEAVAFIKDGSLVDSLAEGEEGGVVLDRTPFYAERGGQVGDTGRIVFPEGEFQVTGTVALGDSVVHQGKMVRGTAVAAAVSAEVDLKRRRAIQANHTATHLLHEALRRALGSHVDQSGSLVAPDRLRFDFTHHEGLDQTTLDAVEDQVNEWVVANLPVSWEDMPFQEAKAGGARALFTE